MAPTTGMVPAVLVRTDRITPNRDSGKVPAEGKEGLFESIRLLIAEQGQDPEIAVASGELILAIAEQSDSDGEPVTDQECLEGIVTALPALETNAVPVNLPLPISQRTDSDEPGKSHPHSQALQHSRPMMYSQAMQQAAAPDTESTIAPVAVSPIATVPGLSAGKEAAATIAATVAATATEQPMAALSDSSRSSGQTETSDDGKDRPQAVAHGQAVQAETRSFTAAVMTASLFEIQRDDTRISAPQIVRQIVESLEYTPAAGVHELVIRLKPDVFGELHIRLEMIDDAISARIITDSHPTRVMLTAHLSQLQDALQDKGLSVKDIQIEYATPNSGDSPSGHPEGDSGRRHSNYAIPTGRHPAEETSKPSAVAWRMERTVRSGGLDYLA